MTRSRAVLAGTLAAFVLAPTAVAAAGPPTSLRTTSAPPGGHGGRRGVHAHRARVRNVSKRAGPHAVTVTLRTTRDGEGRTDRRREVPADARAEALARLPREGPRRPLLAPGRYHVVTCARAGNQPRELRVRQAAAHGRARRRRPRPGAARRAAGGAARRRRRRRAARAGRRGRRDAAGVRLRRRDPPARLGPDRVRHRRRRDERPHLGRHHPAEGDRPTGLKVPIIMDASPYYDTVCRGNEGECKSDVDGDGLNDRWPLFYDNYFVPRGYAVALLDTVGTNNSTGCPTVGGRPDILGITRVIDWLNGRATGYDKQWGGAKVAADWSTGNVGMWGKSFDGTHATGAAATGVEGLRTIVPISGISSWYKYYRIGGLRFSSGGPSGLANTITFPARREQCAPLRQQIATNAGEGTVAARDRRQLQRVLGRARLRARRRPGPGVRLRRARAQRLQRQAQQLRRVVGQPRRQRRPAQDLADADRARRPVRLRSRRVGRHDPPLVRLLAAGHRQRRHGRAARADRAAAEPRRPDARVQDLRGLPRPRRACGPSSGSARPSAAGGPGALSPDKQQTAATATWIDRREQYIERTPGNAPPTEKPAIADPTLADNPNRLVALSPALTKGVRISGRSSVTLRLSADQADAALGAVLVDYGDAPFEAIDYRNADGVDHARGPAGGLLRRELDVRQRLLLPGRPPLPDRRRTRW